MQLRYVLFVMIGNFYALKALEQKSSKSKIPLRQSSHRQLSHKAEVGSCALLSKPRPTRDRIFTKTKIPRPRLRSSVIQLQEGDVPCCDSGYNSGINSPVRELAALACCSCGGEQSQTPCVDFRPWGQEPGKPWPKLSSSVPTVWVPRRGILVSQNGEGFKPV